MADFCIADHFIIGATPVPKLAWFERDAWAMRVGIISPGIQLMQTMERWSCQRLGGPGIVGMCAAYDYLAGESDGSFVPGFNYVFDPNCRSDRLFQQAAEEIGQDAAVISKGAQRALCSQHVYRYEQAHQSWKAAALPYLEDPIAKLANTLLQREKDLQGHSRDFVLGLWTREHGFVHTGRISFSIKTVWDGHVEFEATAAHNIIEASWTGPCAGFSSLQVHQKPVRVALQSWPFRD